MESEDQSFREELNRLLLASDDELRSIVSSGESRGLPPEVMERARDVLETRTSVSRHRPQRRGSSQGQQSAESQILIGFALFILGLIAVLMRAEIAVGIVGRGEMLHEAFFGGSSLQGVYIAIVVVGVGLLIIGGVMAGKGLMANQQQRASRDSVRQRCSDVGFGSGRGGARIAGHDVERLLLKSVCPSCGRDIPDDAAFCQYCGGRIEIVTQCRSCKEMFELEENEIAEMRFQCPNCATVNPLTPKALTRRLGPQNTPGS